jgi:hypothetical protein
MTMSQNTAKWVRMLKKYHKWPGIVLSIFAFLFATSGIILNHRDIISTVDIPRSWMPPGYQYQNWNLSSVRSSLPVGKDSTLIYGNIGIWLFTENLNSFSDFNNGFPKGIDKRKIYSVVKFRDQLVAGTHFGLFTSTIKNNQWKSLSMPAGEEHICDLSIKGDSLLIMTRNFLFFTTDLNRIEQLPLHQPLGYERKAGLFLTLWQLHSGELFGFVGKLFVDLLGIVLLFLSLTGLLHFLFPKLIQRLKRKNRPFATTLSIKKMNLMWHNKIGYIFVLFLVLNTTAGMFLRPPLLIPISSTRVGIIPFSHLDNQNPWQDKLRRVTWNEKLQKFILYTSDGFFFADNRLERDLIPLAHQPIVSIMGCNVLESLDKNRYLIGSFSGLFTWNPVSGDAFDYFTGLPAEIPHGIGRPVGQNMIAGFLMDGNGRNFWIDYNRGIIPTDDGSPFRTMPDEILKKSPISLWNAALEVHTGRIFEHLIGPFYLLYVPLMGIGVLIVLISGFLVWWLAYKKK